MGVLTLVLACGGNTDSNGPGDGGSTGFAGASSAGSDNAPVGGTGPAGGANSAGAPSRAGSGSAMGGAATGGRGPGGSAGQAGDAGASGAAGDAGEGGASGHGGVSGEGGAGGAGPTYSACMTIGAYDRLFIAQFDAEQSLCVRLAVITAPGSGSGTFAGVDTPDGYVAESASAEVGVTQCRPWPLPVTAVAATNATGSVDFRRGSGLPVVGLEFDVTVTFPSGRDVPTSARLRAENLLSPTCETAL